MIIADINVRFSTIDVILRDKLPCGAAGLKVRFRFMDPAWNGLSKIAVFRNRSQTLNVAIVEDCATIPHELLTKVLDVIDVGVYGTDGDKMLGIPTLWGSLGTVASAADPSGDSSMDPTLPYWAQIKEQVDMLENTILGNEDPESIRVSALRTSGGKMSGSIDMCGNMVTGLGSPAGNTDAVNLEYANGHFRSNTWLPTVAEIGAAPAGYGYGDALPTVTGATDAEFLSNIEALCREKISSSTFQAIIYPPGSAFDGYSFIAEIWHKTDNSGNKFVKIKAHGVTVTWAFQRVCYMNTWSEPEWENPPMIPGVEYRTTKRHNGAAVYTKLIHYSPSSFTEQNIQQAHGVSNLDIGLSINVLWNKDGYQWRHFPSVYYGDAAWNGTVYWNGPSTLYFELGATLRQYMAASGSDIRVTIEYTKTA